MWILHGDPSLLFKMNLITIWNTYFGEIYHNPRWMTSLGCFVGKGCLGIIFFLTTHWGVWKGKMELFSNSTFFFKSFRHPNQIALLCFVTGYKFVDTSVYRIYDLLPSVIHWSIILFSSLPNRRIRIRIELIYFWISQRNLVQPLCFVWAHSSNWCRCFAEVIDKEHLCL
jgi:hypothetical protein